MSFIGLGMNLLLAGLLLAALGMGARLNRRLQALRDSHDGFAIAVRELNAAAERAEQGLADLRAATDEATDVLADRIEKGRALAAKLERLTAQPVAQARAAAAPPAPEPADMSRADRLGALLAAAREARTAPPPPAAPVLREVAQLRPRPRPEDDLFEDAPLSAAGGARR